MKSWRDAIGVALTGLLMVCAGCDEPAPEPSDELLSAEEAAELRAAIGELGPLPESRSNAVADDARAVELGRELFYDAELSAEGSGISCAGCHLAELGWSDPRALSLNAEGGPSDAHAQTLTNVAYQEWMFWNGRADSLWAQARGAMIGVHKITPAALTQRLLDVEDYRAAYEELFPAHPLPADPEAEDEDALMRHVVNAAKAIEAFERTIVSRDAPIDRWVAGDEEALSEAQERGAKVFLRAGCLGCHGGPNFSDGWFHNVGVGLPDVKPIGAPDGEIDQAGADAGLVAALGSEFSTAGVYSDDPAWGQARLDTLASRVEAEGASLEGAFKTPSLRDVTLRPLFGRLGRVERLRDWVTRYTDARVDEDHAGELDPLYVPAALTDDQVDDLLLFLEALSGTLDAE